MEKPTPGNTLGGTFEEWMQLNEKFLIARFIEANQKRFDLFCTEKYKEEFKE